MKILYTLLLCCFATCTFAQEDSVRTLPGSPAQPVSALTLGATYGSNENYYGQTPEDKLPYLLFYSAYSSKRGFTLSLSAEKLLSSGYGVAATDITAGYNFRPAKNLGINFAYTRSFYQKDSPLLSTTNPNNLSSSLSYRWALNSSLNVSYAFGTESDVFFSVSNSKMIDLGSLFSERDYITLEPAVDIVAGTTYFYETYTIQRNRRRQKIGPPLYEMTVLQPAGLGILAYTLSLPVAYNRANYSLEARYQASASGQKVSSSSPAFSSVFNLSFFYAF